MAAEKIHIEKFLELAKTQPVIDVRSPGEYNHAHIPGAVSLPLFTDEERKVVGTTYKRQSREQAIKIGLDYFALKMRKMVEEVEQICEWRIKNYDLVKKGEFVNQNSKIILVYCWRGGMRSGAVSWLLDLYGFKVYTLTGGYKKFRNYVLDTFKIPFSFKILGGYTGSGKTEVLKKIKDKETTVIDLEDIAKHKGSAFGNIGMPKQPTQEMFENILAQELQKSMVNSHWPTRDQNNAPFPFHHSPVWLEDESQRIGHVNIPNELWKTMRKSPVFFLDIPFEERLKHITEEYGKLDKIKMIEAIGRIREKLGGLNAKTAIQMLEEDNIIESFRILLKYYDKLYMKALHNREELNSLLHLVNCESVTPENANLLATRTAHQPQKL